MEGYDTSRDNINKKGYSFIGSTDTELMNEIKNMTVQMLTMRPGINVDKWK